MQVPSFPLPPPGGKVPRWSAPVSFYGLGVYRVFYLAFLLLTTVPAVLGYAPRATDTVRSNILSGCASTYVPSLDYFPDKAVVTGELFSITYFNSYKIVNVTSVRYGFSEAYLLYQCGTPKPAGYDELKSFAVPVTTAGTDTTTVATYLELLGVRPRIELLSSPSYFTSPCLQTLIAAGNITALSYDAVEAEGQIGPLGVFFADAYNWDTSGENVPGAPNVATDVASELTPIDRAEWIEFFGAFFNREAAANAAIRSITTRYFCHSNNVKTYADAGNKPTIAFVVVYEPPFETYEVSTALYKKRYAEDAGGQLFEPTVTSFDNVQELMAALLDVDIVIDESYPKPTTWEEMLTLYKLNDSSPHKFIQNSAVFANDRLQNPDGGQAWFESALAQADIVLRDFVSIIHPEYPYVNDTIYLRRLRNPAQSIVVATADECTDATAALPLLPDRCVPFASVGTPTATPTATPTPTAAAAAAGATPGVLAASAAAAAVVLLLLAA